MTTALCPTTIELYAWMDGESDVSSMKTIRAHVRSCDECRSRVRSLSRVEGVLGSRPELPLDDIIGFEDRFLVRLMDRMVTSQEARRLRMRPRPALIAAGVILIAGCVAAGLYLRPAPTTDRAEPARESVRVAKEDPTIKARREWQAIVERSTEDAAVTGREIARAAYRWNEAGVRWRSWHDEWLDAGSIESLEASMWMTATTRPYAITQALDALFERCNGDAVAMHRLARSAVDLPLGSGLRWLVEHAGKEVDRSMVVTVLLERNDSRLLGDVRRLVDGAGVKNTGAVLAALAAAPHELTDGILLDLYLEGDQSGSLRGILGSRPHLVADARREAFSSVASTQRRERALRLIGDYRDETSLPGLVRLLDDDRLAEVGVDVVSQIGSEFAIRELGTRAPTSASSMKCDRAEWLRLAIRRFGDVGARYYLDRVGEPSMPWRTHFVVAAGLCRSPEAVPRLLGLVEEDDVKSYAVRAIAESAEQGGTVALQRLVRHRDQTVASLARSELARLSNKNHRRARSFVLLDGVGPPMPFDSPDLLLPIPRRNEVARVDPVRISRRRG